MTSILNFTRKFTNGLRLSLITLEGRPLKNKPSEYLCEIRLIFFVSLSPPWFRDCKQDNSFIYFEVIYVSSSFLYWTFKLAWSAAGACFVKSSTKRKTEKNWGLVKAEESSLAHSFRAATLLLAFLNFLLTIWGKFWNVRSFFLYLVVVVVVVFFAHTNLT